ncbi:hypothetical protein ACROYT_G016752 [Oculina patagonica]
MLKLNFLPLAKKNCGICKSKRHKLQHCPNIKKCEHVAVRRQYAASCGFCFNCGLERPGHGSGSCPEPPACSKCPGRHLSLLHTDQTQDSRRPNPPINKDSKDKGDRPSATSYPTSHEGVNTETQVLLNVVPVIITAENGNAVSTYAFLDSGCTDTLVDRSLVDYLDIQGTPEQVRINTITRSDNAVESNRVSFTLSSLESFGESIEVFKAYVLPDLNQLQRALPEQIDVQNYPHLCTIGIAADIEGMFHQIRVRKEDQDSLRFLWWTNGYEDPPDVYVMQVHIFGAASSPCVANSTLRRVADDNAEDFSPSVIAAVKRNFYVDDALPSQNDEQSAIHLAQDMVNILA